MLFTSSSVANSGRLLCCTIGKVPNGLGSVTAVLQFSAEFQFTHKQVQQTNDDCGATTGSFLYIPIKETLRLRVPQHVG